MRPPVHRLAAPALALALLLTGCTGAPDPDSPESPDSPAAPAPDVPSSGIRTLAPVPLPPDPPPSGRLVAEIRQSSLDAANQQMQVWVDNDTEGDATPTRLVYRDTRLPADVAGQNLRALPAQAERGYPLALPDVPACTATRRRAMLEVQLRRGRGLVTRRIPVADPTDVVGRYLAGRCAELRVAGFARLRWEDDVARTDAPRGSTGRLTLVVRPRGDASRSLRIVSVAGTPLLGSARRPPVWTPDVTVAGDDPTTRVRLALKPARCDLHAFMEGGGSTAFAVAFVLDGRAGTVLLRMSARGADRAVEFARDSCGLE